MGAQPGTYAEELSKPGAIPGIPAITGADQPLDVLRRRPDIIAAERRLAASNERIGVAISDYYPKISLSGALGFDSTNGALFLTGRRFSPLGRERCGGGFSILERSQLRSPSRAAPMPKRLLGIGKPPRERLDGACANTGAPRGVAR
jgi:hypothetical protein